MFDESRPIFLQLAERLENEILQGVYETDEQVPSTNELATFLRINPATAGKALNLLVEKKILYKRRGIGMFVTEEAAENIVRERTDNFKKTHITELVKRAQILGISLGELENLIATNYTKLEAESNLKEERG